MATNIPQQISSEHRPYDSIICGHVYIISIDLIYKFYTELMLITSYGKERQNNFDFFLK